MANCHNFYKDFIEDNLPAMDSVSNIFDFFKDNEAMQQFWIDY